MVHAILLALTLAFGGGLPHFGGYLGMFLSSAVSESNTADPAEARESNSDADNDAGGHWDPLG
jgi:hypothetical protein